MMSMTPVVSQRLFPEPFQRLSDCEPGSQMGSVALLHPH